MYCLLTPSLPSCAHPHLCPTVQMYLPELLALAVCLLEGGVQPLLVQDEGASTEDVVATTELAEGAREVRGRSLRMVAAVLERFPTGCDLSFLWPRLLAAAQPLLPAVMAALCPVLDTSAHDALSAREVKIYFTPPGTGVFWFGCHPVPLLLQMAENWLGFCAQSS